MGRSERFQISLPKTTNRAEIEPSAIAVSGRVSTQSTPFCVEEYVFGKVEHAFDVVCFQFDLTLLRLCYDRKETDERTRLEMEYQALEKRVGDLGITERMTPVQCEICSSFHFYVLLLSLD
jgi:hypothetical protein